MDLLLGDCELMRLRITARLDGRLSAPHQAELTRHLDRCDACTQFARTLAGLTEVLGAQWGRPTTPNPEVQAQLGKVSCLLLLGALTIGA
jgi:predicted anti-sigma-YlaC factor YlaD